ncbi:MAG: hypothetical protein V3V33_10005 [Candidatus Lokiarchaeia archaeon]
MSMWLRCLTLITCQHFCGTRYGAIMSMILIRVTSQMVMFETQLGTRIQRFMCPIPSSRLNMAHILVSKRGYGTIRLVSIRID